jgi:hypothetical protein
MNGLQARLAARMQSLGARDDEVGRMVGVPAERVAEWREGAVEIDGASAVRLRPFLADGNGGAAALTRLRTRKTESLLPHGVSSFPSVEPFPGTPPRRDGDAPK